MSPMWASTIAALVTAITGMLGWQLSARAQRASAARQKAIEQGPYVESLQSWSREIVAWYQGQMERAEQRCREELRDQRMECDEKVRSVQARCDYWKNRALGRDVSDDTPPEDHT